jgi:putative addiction module component (TIGR02574 family)
MTTTVEQLKSQLAALPPVERAELAQFLIRSIEEDAVEAGPADPTVEAAWNAELARRLADIQAGKVTGRPAAEVFAALREKLS